MSNIQIKESDFIFYNGEDGKVHAQVILGDETVWVSQNSLAEIFGTSKQLISYHLGNIFKENELSVNSVVKEILTTESDGKKYRTMFYNLDVIIVVGHRISSYTAALFY
ncbi:MAG: cell filamentation protein Fic [Chitinophagia bacterium]|nr:cell filamentation protein Fic [Chitinophagia bacterium]